MAIFQNFFNSVNNKYDVTTKLDNAKVLLKNADVGTAVVNVLGATGIAGFKFHIPKTEQVKLQADITDHYTDLNNPVQDHIALKPVELTLTGLVGEYFYSVNEIEDILANVVPTLSLVKQFMPKLTDATMYVKTLFNKKTTTSYKVDKNGKILEKENIKDYSAMDLFSLFQEIYKLKSAQTRAFFFFEALCNARAIFSVETTWKRYDNMTLLSVTPLRDENADITDFTVTFKQMNFTTSLSRSLNNAVGRTRDELDAIANKGVDKGKKVEA